MASDRRTGRPGPRRPAATPDRPSSASGATAAGPGSSIAPGRVLTNAHNLRDETTEVRFADGRTAQGAVVGSDVDGDLVVLDVDTGDVPVLAWSDDAVDAGDVVVAVTAGRHRRRATWGQVTATEAGVPRPPRPADRAAHRAHLAVRLPARPERPCSTARAGSSASTPTASSTASTSPAPSTRRSARPSRRWSRVVVRAVRLGVALAPADVAARLRRSVGLGERDGLLVRGVVDGSPAAAAGIREGDLLVRAGDRDLRRPTTCSPCSPPSKLEATS